MVGRRHGRGLQAYPAMHAYRSSAIGGDSCSKPSRVLPPAHCKADGDDATRTTRVGSSRRQTMRMGPKAIAASPSVASRLSVLSSASVAGLAGHRIFGSIPRHPPKPSLIRCLGKPPTRDSRFLPRHPFRLAGFAGPLSATCRWIHPAFAPAQSLASGANPGQRRSLLCKGRPLQRSRCGRIRWCIG
jgi:hypothetical protein